MDIIEVRFIRHAKGTHMLNEELIVGRSEKAELTDEGRADAFRKGQELARRGIIPDLVVASSAKRCAQTAAQLLAGMGLSLPIEERDELLEMDQANSVGLDRNKVYKNEAVQRQIKRLGKNFALPGGESMNQVGLRGTEWLQSVQGTVAHNTLILAVAHKGLITHTVGTLKNWNQPTSLKKLKIVEPLSETVLGFDGKRWHVRSFAQP